MIRIVDTGDAPPAPYEGLSTVWSFEPEGLQFAEPVKVQLPYDASWPVPTVYWSDGAGGYTALEATYADGIATASIDHFSTGFVARGPTETVEFADYYPPMDVLFVVEKSPRMADPRAQLGADAGSMFDALERAPLDFHVGVTSTSIETTQAGGLTVVNGSRFLDAESANVGAVFDSMLVQADDVMAAGPQEGRAAAFINLYLTTDRPRNLGFFREEGTLDLVFVTGGDDRSGDDPISKLEFENWLRGLKADQDDLDVHAITMIPGQSTCGISAGGPAYVDYAGVTGGLVADVCSDDFTGPLVELVERRLDRARVTLPTVPAGLVEVAFVQNGVTRLVLDPADYRVVDATLYFDQGSRPVAGDSIRVVFGI